MDIGKMKTKFAACVAAGIMATCLAMPAIAFADPDPAEGTFPGVVSKDGSASSTASNDSSTDLYVKYSNPGNMADTDGNQSNFKVQVPVALNFAVDYTGNIEGPSSASIVNYSKFKVHVQSIAVSDNIGSNGVTIVDTASPTDADQVYLECRTNTGVASSAMYKLADLKPTDEAAAVNPAGLSSAVKYDWCMSASGVTGNATEDNPSADGRAIADTLQLTDFSGKVNGFKAIDPLSRQKVGAIEWNIAPGWTWQS